MKLQIICENCNNIVELVPMDNGKHANMTVLRDTFWLEEIELDLHFEYADDEDEAIVDAEPEVKEIRFDCATCDEYIVLNEFPNHVYRYR